MSELSCAACAAQAAFASGSSPSDALAFAFLLGFASGAFAQRTGRGACFCPGHGADMHKILTGMGAELRFVVVENSEKPS
jgi:hypothetical protein